MVLDGDLSAIALCKPQYWLASLCGRVICVFITLPQKMYQKSFHLIVTFLLKTSGGLIMQIKWLLGHRRIRALDFMFLWPLQTMLSMLSILTKLAFCTVCFVLNSQDALQKWEITHLWTWREWQKEISAFSAILIINHSFATIFKLCAIQQF